MPLLPMADREEIEHAKHLEQGKSGAHFCPEWDFMAIHDAMPEAKACLCDLSHFKAPPAPEEE